MRQLFSKNVLLFVSIGTVLLAAIPSKSEAKTLTQENRDKDVEQAPFTQISPILNPTINPESNESLVESSESLEVAAVSSEALGEIEPISVERYLSLLRHSEPSPHALTMGLQENTAFALVSPEDVSSQQPGCVIVGMQVQYLRQTLDLDIDVSGPNLTFAFDKDLGTDEVWVEPLFSTQLRYNFSRNLGLTSRADFSGLGINGLPFTWRWLSGIDWIFAGDTSFSAGYSVFGIKL